MMRVLIIANYALGLYQFRRELITELLKTNEVYITLPYGKLIDELKKIGCKYIETDLDRRNTSLIQDFKLLVNYYRLLCKLRPDLVITYTIKPNIYGGIASNIKKITYVENITGLGTAFEKKGILRLLVKNLYKLSAKNAKVVFFENSMNKKIFVEEKIIEEKQAKVLNGAGVNLDYFRFLEYPQNPETRFLFIGRVMREKGIIEILEAMKLLIKDNYSCFLDIVGPLEEDYSKLIESCELNGFVKYHGYQDDVRPYIERCDCFVLPSYHEGMANTNLECGASGRPVITSNIPGCQEAVLNGVSGFLCEPKDTQSLYVSMKRFIQLDKTERIKMGKEARKHIENNFDKRIIVKETIEKIYG